MLQLKILIAWQLYWLVLAGFRHVCASDNFSSAYRCHYSTETALLHTDSIYCSSDQGRPLLLVSLDLSPAFDIIDHHLLLDRLNESFGISCTAHSWLKSYFSNRHQSIRAGHSESPRTHWLTGVPRASVLGPLLFTCYISPISSIASSLDVSIQQYADDTKIYIVLTTADVTTHLTRLSSCLSVLHNWFCHNGLALNSSKSEFILFGTRQRQSNFPLVFTPTITGSQIPSSDNIKTLVVTRC